MYTKQEIILRHYREGKSQRQISKELQISRKTVKKYIDQYQQRLKGSESNTTVQVNFLTERLAYQTGPRPKLKLTQDVASVIDELLLQNKKNKQLGLHKQLLKKIDILEELHSRDIDIGYTTVCNYISQKEQHQTKKEAFIRQEYQPGQVCEFDWGEIKLQIKGKLTKLYLAVFTSAYSNYRYAVIYHRQDTLAFQDSHVKFFKQTQGVFHQLVYDNMRVAVARFVGKHQKEPTEALLQMRAYYGFSHRFCNAYRGNEKGHVERSVEYVRRKAFAPQHEFDSLEQATTRLNTTLERLNGTKQQQTQKTALELFAQEQEQLMPHPPAEMSCYELIELRVDKYSTVSYKTNRYSVPEQFVGAFLEVKVYENKLIFIHENKPVANHKRNFGKHNWVVNIPHYLETFRRKPGALPGSVALASNNFLKELFDNYFSDQPREFIELLAFCQRHQTGQEKIESSVKLLNQNTTHMSVDKLKAMLANSDKPNESIPNSTITNLSENHLKQAQQLFNSN